MVKITELVGADEDEGVGMNMKDIKDIIGVFKEMGAMKQQPEQAPARSYPLAKAAPTPAQMPVQSQTQNLLNTKEQLANIIMLMRIVRGRPYTIKEIRGWLRKATDENLLTGVPHIKEAGLILRAMRQDMNDSELIDFLRGKTGDKIEGGINGN